MRGNCKQCDRYGELKHGKCAICLPRENRSMKSMLQRKLNSPKFKEAREKVNRKFEPLANELSEKELTEAQFMRREWEKRPHVSFINGEPLNAFSYMKCAHVLPKGAYRRWKKEGFNLVFMTEGQHHKQHTVPRSELEKEHPGWVKFFKMQDYYRECYNRNLIPNPNENFD